MRGVQEIFVSFAIGLASLLAFAWMHSQLEVQKRLVQPEEPIASSGPSEDIRLSLNWGLEEVHAPAVRKRHKGSKDVIVAVIDTGCDVHHPSFAGNIWTNPGETGLDEFGRDKATNGLDDDGDGFIDDVHGWDFTSNSGDVSDNHGHGTHIAGIIGGAEGVAPGVTLMPLKYFDTESSGYDNLKNTVAAIRFAVDHGASIINYSGGGSLRSREEEAVLRWAAARGVLLVAAAGNEGLNSDFDHFYPADYDLPNVLSVAAIDRDEKLMRMSNYGMHTVDVAAPGRNIYSTLPQGQHGYMSGTSQATAFATGVAALLMSDDPRLREPTALIEHVLMQASPRLALKGKVRSNGVLDAAKALQASENELASLSQKRSPAQAD